MGFVENVYAEEEAVEEEYDEDEEEEELEFTSAIITALTCAEEAQETGEFDVLSSCPPHAAWEGVKDIYEENPKIVIYDVTEDEYYAVKPTKDGIYWSDLLEGFGGSIDGTAEPVGKEGELVVIKFTEFEITPKPKPGFFKGCL
ncbi:MAG: hypothetical protein GXO21_01080 [Aquificae bacterium]|nr:hypothetical protein [Aquificota bacterium]